MIYLFDDKINRQTDYGWNEENLVEYFDIIKPIYRYLDIEDASKKVEIFSENNIVLFHESFFDNVENVHHRTANEIRNRLAVETQRIKNFKVVFFSGSKSARKLDGNIGYIPVSVLYQNLKVFLNKSKQGDSNLNFLLFGENFEIESLLLKKISEANNNIELNISLPQSTQKNFVALTLENEIGSVLENAHYETFYPEERHNNEMTDAYFSELIEQWFSFSEYDNIFLPICFGSTLSDYNGLRFALHLRCTNSANRLSSIFLYSVVNHSYLIGNEYFDILKTKGIRLIDYSSDAFTLSASTIFQPITIVELSGEMKKIKLDPPKNYEDSHSITNEWAIYRWANTINANDSDIVKIIGNVNTNIYFKYLQAVYPISPSNKISDSELRIKYSGKPRILYIDDQAEQGWYEVFCKILYDINKLDFDKIDNEYYGKSREEIISHCLERIRIENIDLVILDFRLHPDDFKEKDLNQVTGLRILREIKNLNAGIQVIIFSATNNIWNIEALRAEKADGFITKESPALSVVSNFTSELILHSKDTIQECLSKCFLKDFYAKLDLLKLELNPRKILKSAANPLPKVFVDEVLSWLHLSYDMLNLNQTRSNQTAAFIFMFSVLENLSSRVIDVDNPIKTNDPKKPFQFEFRMDKRKLLFFIDDPNNIGHYIKTNTILFSQRNIPWTQKILNTLDYVSDKKLSQVDISDLVKTRNDFIHANNTTGQKFELTSDTLIRLNNVLYTGLIKVV